MAESVTSTVTTVDNQEDSFINVSSHEIFLLLEDTYHDNEVLAAETDMFERSLRRVESKEDATVVGGSQGFVANVQTTPSTSTNDLLLTTMRVGRKRSKSRSSTTERSLRLTAEQKCDVAQREIEAVQEDVRHMEDESERVLDHYRAIIEEADSRLIEIKKDSYEFERDIVKGGVNPRSGKYTAEKIVRFIEDKLRSRDTLIEKLRLKNATLRVQKKKLLMQLKQKEEMGEVLHEVDFSQLKIENQQYIEKIDERNQDLLRLKLMAGNTLQILNAYKKKLHTLTLDSHRLKGEISSRQDLLTRIDSETSLVDEERTNAGAIHRRLRRQLTNYRVPDVMEYVQEKADLYELKKNVRSWNRKVEIAEMALRTNQKAWQQMKQTARHMNAWPAIGAAN